MTDFVSLTNFLSAFVRLGKTGVCSDSVEVGRRIYEDSNKIAMNILSRKLDDSLSIKFYVYCIAMLGRVNIEWICGSLPHEKVGNIPLLSTTL